MLALVMIFLLNSRFKNEQLNYWNTNRMKIKELYVAPRAEVYVVLAEQALTLSFNQTEQTENLAWDSDEEDL